MHRPIKKSFLSTMSCDTIEVCCSLFLLPVFPYFSYILLRSGCFWASAFGRCCVASSVSEDLNSLKIYRPGYIAVSSLCFLSVSWAAGLFKHKQKHAHKQQRGEQWRRWSRQFSWIHRKSTEMARSLPAGLCGGVGMFICALNCNRRETIRNVFIQWCTALCLVSSPPSLFLLSCLLDHLCSLGLAELTRRGQVWILFAHSNRELLHIVPLSLTLFAGQLKYS